MIEKRNVIDGTVKTAEADNEDDAIGMAAKCIADAEAAARDISRDAEESIRECGLQASE